MFARGKASFVVIVVVSLALSFHFPQILPQFRCNLISFIFHLA